MFCQLPTELKTIICNMAIEMSFENWMAAIDTYLMTNYLVELTDFPDEPFRDYHEEGLTPTEVAEIMIENNTGLM